MAATAAEREAPDLLTVVEVARRLRVSPDTVRRLALNGELPGVRVGSLYRFHRSDVDAFLEPRTAA